MNENPEGTPNPLNPYPGSQDLAPTPEPIASAASEPVSPVEPMPEEPVQPIEEVVGAAEQKIEVATPLPESAPAQPIIEPAMNINDQSISSTQINPDSQTTQTVEPAKKSGKKIATIFAVIFILVAIGCGAAAIVILKPFGQDAVPAALSKLMNGAPSIVKIDGVATLNFNNQSSYVSNLKLDFKADLDNISGGNTISAKVAANFENGEEFSFGADEIHTKDGNLYLKLSGISGALEKYYDMLPNTHMKNSIKTNCVGDTSSTTNCTASSLSSSTTSQEKSTTISESLGLIDVINDEWILIPGSSFSNVSDLINSNVSSGNKTSQCLIDAAGNLGEYGSNFAKLYNDNQFIAYSTDSIPIAKKKDAIYRLYIDAEKLAGFINAMTNSGFLNELSACMGGMAMPTGITVSADALKPMIAFLPNIYVEIDDDNNFTRVYLESSSDITSVTVDLSFSYPTSITIEEPDHYIDFNENLSQIFDEFYSNNVIDVESVVNPKKIIDYYEDFDDPEDFEGLEDAMDSETIERLMKSMENYQ